jgi:MbtH protein
LYPDGLKDGAAARRKIDGLPTTGFDRRQTVILEEDDVTNPFEDENGVYHVLINDEGQHSLWPSFIQVPEGWTIIHESGSRSACLEFINQHWTDMRPNSLIEHMKELSGSEQPKGTRASETTDAKGNVLPWDHKTRH